MMMMVLMAAPRGIRGDESVRPGSRSAASFISRTAIVMVMALTLMAFKTLAIAVGVTRVRPPGHGAVVMMMVMSTALRGGNKGGEVAATRSGPRHIKMSDLRIRGVILMGPVMIASAGPSCLGARHTYALQALPAPEAGASTTG